MADQPRGPGRFSDTYAPERRCIPLASWPEQDRLAFGRARRPGDVFELPGPAAAWAAETCRARVQAYGRYLNYLQRGGLLLDDEGPEVRATSDRLTGYLAEAREFLSPRTIGQTLLELSRIISAMVPTRDWRWIRRHPAGPSTREMRESRKPARTFDPTLLCCKALDLMDQISAGVLAKELRLLYRNALIVAMQCIFALRRRNLVDMTLGRNLVIGDNLIHLIFTQEETKNYMPISCTLPHFVKPYLLTYLRDHRPVLLAGNVCDAVWIDGRHHALKYGAIAFLFDSIGVRLLGYPINCHCFRHSVATRILTKDPRKIRTASGVLGHCSLRSVNQHYDLSGAAGSRRAWDKLRRDIIRGDLPERRAARGSEALVARTSENNKP